mmetsp:Transcript_7066/g.18295  ORF Transcript_7066/g.18295 Transcript_7066/m.18295 type:complete len:269 (-) Transcript_7066:735-1541(-)
MLTRTPYSKGAGSAGPPVVDPSVRAVPSALYTVLPQTSRGTPAARTASRTCTECSGPVHSMINLICTRSTADCSHARSWKTSLTDAPCSLRSDVTSAMPPARSETSATKRTSLQSAAKPRSMTRPRVVTSMLPPHSGTATRFPWTSLCIGPPGKMAAKPVAPPPSTITFSFSSRRRTDNATSLSSTMTTSSVCARATSKALPPTVGTARPSANVEVVGAGTGSPASKAAVNDAQFRGSTPITRVAGRSVFDANATPANKPAPPQGTMM